MKYGLKSNIWLPYSVMWLKRRFLATRFDFINTRCFQWFLLPFAFVVLTACTTVTSNLEIINKFESLPKDYKVEIYDDGGDLDFEDISGVVVGTVHIKGLVTNDFKARQLARKYGANYIIAYGEYENKKDFLVSKYDSLGRFNSFQSVSRTEVSGTYILVRSDELLCSYVRTNEAFEGVFPDGAPWFRTELRDGVPHGSHVEYSPDGDVRQELVFKDGQLWEGVVHGETWATPYVRGLKHGDGYYTTYDTNEKKTIHYENGISGGIQYTSINGKIPVGRSGEVREDKSWGHQIVPFDEEGRVHGVLKRFNEAGNLSEEIPYVHGLRNGVHKVYHEDGSVYSTTPYVEGILQGVETKYDENGVVFAETYYDRGNRNGLDWFGTINGKPSQYSNYLDGLLHGISGAVFLGDEYYWLGIKVAPYRLSD